jgi:hypothetical protein
MTVATETSKRTEPSPYAALVLPEHWSCALLRALIVERGWNATCAPTLRAALFGAARAPKVVLLDLDALTDGDRAVLRALARAEVRPRLLLLAHALTQALPPGRWAVLRKPIGVDAIADAVAKFEGEPDASVRSEPWPRASSDTCGVTRHYEPPRTGQEEDAVRADMVRFVVEHAR